MSAAPAAVRVLRAAAALLVLGLGLRADAAAARVLRLRIVHTNDLHGHVERAAATAGLAARLRAEADAALFLDAGDCISGTPVSTAFQGRPIFDVLSALRYDAGTLGNHEFDHGHALVAEFRERASFPLLCANARGPDGALLADGESHVFEVGGLRVGVLGLVTAEVPRMTARAATAGCTFEAPLEAAKRLVPELRARCDVLVLLTHVGVEEDAALAGAVPGIDVIVGGHSHTELRTGLLVGSTRIVQARSNGAFVGVVDLEYDTQARRVATTTARLERVDPESGPRDGAVQELVDAWEARVADQVAEVIGRTSRRLDRRALRERLEAILADLADADLGYQNASGVRADVAAGDISIRHVWEVLPFDGTLVRLRVRGRDLPAFARERLGARYDPAHEYTLATSSYVADQQSKYLGLRDVPVEDTGRQLRDEVVGWVRSHGGFDPEGRPLPRRAADGK